MGDVSFTSAGVLLVTGGAAVVLVCAAGSGYMPASHGSAAVGGQYSEIYMINVRTGVRCFNGWWDCPRSGLYRSKSIEVSEDYREYQLTWSGNAVWVTYAVSQQYLVQ